MNSTLALNLIRPIFICLTVVLILSFLFVKSVFFVFCFLSGYCVLRSDLKKAGWNAMSMARFARMLRVRMTWFTWVLRMLVAGFTTRVFKQACWNASRAALATTAATLSSLAATLSSLASFTWMSMARFAWMLRVRVTWFTWVLRMLVAGLAARLLEKASAAWNAVAATAATLTSFSATLASLSSFASFTRMSMARLTWVLGVRVTWFTWVLWMLVARLTTRVLQQTRRASVKSLIFHLRFADNIVRRLEHGKA